MKIVLDLYLRLDCTSHSTIMYSTIIHMKFHRNKIIILNSRRWLYYINNGNVYKNFKGTPHSRMIE